jgi:hypothetical protein
VAASAGSVERLEHVPKKVETGFPRDKRGTRLRGSIMLKQRDEIVMRFRLMAS